MPNYGDARYWDDRYTKQPGTTFDWLEGWSDLKEVTLRYCLEHQDKVGDQAQNSENQENELSERERESQMLSNLKVLNLGCGNSILAEDMYDDGIQQVYNMDISAVCIQQMKLRNLKSRPQLKWNVMDVR